MMITGGRKHIGPVMLVFFLLLTTIACSISFGKKGGDENVESMKLQLTVQALQMTQQSSANSNNAQSASANPPASSSSASQSNSSQSEEIEAETEEEDEIPCNDSHIIGETIKDGTVYKPGATFEKTWTLRNEGDCDWTSGYTYKFIEGSRMGGASSISVPSVIEPNEEITFKVNLTAPDKPGDYTGVWQLFADDGEELGRYWVKITVAAPAAPFAVTSVSTNINNSNFSGACPQEIHVDINITANGAGTVIFNPETSDLGNHPTNTFDFDSAGTQSTSYTWIVHASGNYWLKIHVTDPNNQTFGPFNLTVTCN
jgi:hypothetical protein